MNNRSVIVLAIKRYADRKTVECLLHDSRGVLEAALLLGFASHPHSRFHEYVNGHSGHVLVTVELLADLALNLFHELQAVLVKEGHEGFEDAQVKGRGYELAVTAPLLTCAY